VALRAPTVEKVQATVAQLEENPRTSLADRALKLLFDAHPKNTEVPLVLQKVANAECAVLAANLRCDSGWHSTLLRSA